MISASAGDLRNEEGQVGQESNLQPAVLETAALPIELPTYS